MINAYHPGLLLIVGKSDSGKTTLMEKLIPALKKRGYRIGTIKHSAHGFDMDKKGKDSWRHKVAGAEMTAVVSGRQIAIVKQQLKTTLKDVQTYFDGFDLVLVEGFKNENFPKIEVFRGARNGQPLCLQDNNLVAFVTDTDIRPPVACFGLEDIAQLADFIENRFITSNSTATPSIATESTQA